MNKYEEIVIPAIEKQMAGQDFLQTLKQYGGNYHREENQLSGDTVRFTDMFHVSDVDNELAWTVRIYGTQDGVDLGIYATLELKAWCSWEVEVLGHVDVHYILANKSGEMVMIAVSKVIAFLMSTLS